MRVWGATNEEFPLKFGARVLSGAIADIAWTGDSQRIAVVGEGKEKLGAVFMWDAGSSVGEITGHSKPLLAVDLKPQRPFRLATGGEDNFLGWFEGPPFKFKKSVKDVHTRFINSVRFSPDGELLAVCSSDKKVSVYDGKTGDLKFTREEHKAGVYDVAWSADSAELLTVGADKTAVVMGKDGSVLRRYVFENRTERQQLGAAYTARGFVSVSLDSDMAVLDGASEKVVEVLSGHARAITALTVVGAHIYTAGSDGRVVRWERESGRSQAVSGVGHAARVNGLVAAGKQLVTLGADDQVKLVDTETCAFVGAVSLGTGANCGVALASGAVVVGTNKGLSVVADGKVVWSEEIADGVASVGLSADGKTVAAGLSGRGAVVVYGVAGSELRRTGEVTDGIQAPVTCVRYSPDGEHVVTCDGTRYIVLRKAADFGVVYDRWVPHNSRVNDVAFDAAGKHIATAGADSYTYVLDVETKQIRQVGRTHPTGCNGVAFLDEATFCTAGADATVKFFELGNSTPN